MLDSRINLSAASRRLAVNPVAFLLADLFTILTLTTMAQAQDGSVDTSFNPFITGGYSSVQTIAVQPDGKVLIGGTFVQVGGAIRRNVARLNSDGSLDASFNSGSGPNGAITKIALFADGRILLAGSFTAYNSVARNGLARINADGTLDTTYNPDNGINGAGQTIAIQPDNKILLGSNLFALGMPSNAPRLIRLNADGSRDTAFNFNAVNSNVNAGAIALQADGKILVGGGSSVIFTNGTPPKNLARLNADGSVDTTFNVGTNVNGAVTQIVVQPDNKILVAGSFTSYNATTANGLIRVNADGSLETVFPAVVSDTNSYTVSNILLLPDNKVLFAFSGYRPDFTSEEGLRRFNPDGTIDTAFAPPATIRAFPLALALQADGKILLNNDSPFITINQERSNLIRLKQSGSADNGFAPVIRGVGSINSIDVQANGKTVIGGSFSQVDNIARPGVARLNANGSLDTGFNPEAGFNISVSKVLTQPDGKLLVGGFTFFSTDAGKNAIVRLNDDGSFDSSFGSPLKSGSQVFEIALQPDGKILLAGSLRLDSDLAVRSLMRLNADGTIDSSFNSTPANANVGAILVLADGKIIVGGSSVSEPNTTIPALKRIFANGDTDASFTVSSDVLIVRALELQPDGKLLVGGSIRTVDGKDAGIARLNGDGSFDSSFASSGRSSAATNVTALKLQPDNRILYSGSQRLTITTGTPTSSISTFGFSVGILGRLTQNGFEDNSFARGNTVAVNDIALQDNNKIVVGGTFDGYNNILAYSIVRLNNTLRPRTTSFDFDGDARADIAVFRPNGGFWYSLRSAANNNFNGTQWGANDDQLAPADYDGDGKTDFAVFRNNSAASGGSTFYILNSRDNTVRIEQFGSTGDVPVAGDWDADGKADLAVYRRFVGTPENAPPSYFYYRPSGSPGVDFRAVQWGLSSDKPVVGDFDADGKQDAAVFRPSNGVWYILQSLTNTVRYEQWGISADKLVAADYDGDSKTDVAVFRDGIWYIKQSATDTVRYEYFGIASDTPVAADYDGDGRADAAVYRNGVWYLQRSQTGFAAIQFGADTDKPIPAAYMP